MRPPSSPAAESTDEATVVALARQNPRAFAPLYERYLDGIFRYCYRRLGSREAAEDATSQVFARALAGLASYQDGSFAAWLYTIAHNVVVDAHRRRRPEDRLVDLPEPIDVEPTPEEAALAADEGRTVRAMLQTLPVDQRRVLELRLAELTGVEIAAVLGRSVAAVKMLQLRAMTRLRADLGVAKETTNGHGAARRRSRG